MAQGSRLHGNDFLGRSRGYHITYRENEVNYCPGCGRSHWYIGSQSAECAFCGTALPLRHAAWLTGPTTRAFRPLAAA